MLMIVHNPYGPLNCVTTTSGDGKSSWDQAFLLIVAEIRVTALTCFSLLVNLVVG